MPERAKTLSGMFLFLQELQDLLHRLAGLLKGVHDGLLPFLGLRKHENYYEYKQEKAEKRHPITAAVPVSGIFWLLLGGLFLTLALR